MVNEKVLKEMGLRGAILTDVPMRRYTTMKVGGCASYLIYPVDIEDLAKTVLVLKDLEIPYRFLGNGSNIIVHDNGYKGAIVRITRIRQLKYERGDDYTTVEVSGGFPLRRLIRIFADKSLSGLERMYYIPGTLGGAVKMNAGSFGTSISKVLVGALMLNGSGKTFWLEAEDMGFGYRSSSLKKDECVVIARLRLTHRSKDEIKKNMAYVYNERLSRHPMELPSSGSVFKAVEGRPAWHYIEEANLKGLKLGGAMVSEKHGNFIVNTGSATASDIVMLIERIKKVVFEVSGVTLEEEVEFLGFEDR
ncbi:MAG: UDP-N-acetylmuramate dehydrogenase [Syntrophorhabdaceae bacterium]|nr:UDP-N-acetylmuramate dehydrogenase [Syntrophorhabdaceae bacterium]